MAYEQFYTGYLLICYILTSIIPLWTNFLDLKDSWHFCQKGILNLGEFLYFFFIKYIICKSNWKLDTTVWFFFLYASCELFANEYLLQILLTKKRKAGSCSRYTSQLKLPLYNNIYTKNLTRTC